MSDQRKTDDIFAEAMASAGRAAEAGGPPPPPAGSVTAEQAEFMDLGSASALAGEVPLSMLLDLTLPVSIELGRTSMTVQEILRLGRGAVVQLDRLAGEPIDIYVGERRFAEGEVVVLGEHFGVRITRIVSRGPNGDLN